MTLCLVAGRREFILLAVNISVGEETKCIKAQMERNF